MKNRIMATFLAFFLVLGMLPGTARAAEQTTVYAKTTAQLQAALKSNTKIVLEGKDYLVKTELSLMNLENVTIQGTTGTRIISLSQYDEVIDILDCKNLVLDNLVLGHDPAAEGGCTHGVIYAGGSELAITNCDLFGCGRVGIEARNSTITVEKSTIRDCSERILELSKGSTVFRDCVFSGNGYNKDSHSSAIRNDYAETLAFYGCTFRDNKNPRFIDLRDHIVENCTFINNGWGDDWKPIVITPTPPDEPNPDLPKLAPPTDLVWGTRYEYTWSAAPDPTSQTRIDNSPGYASWNPGPDHPKSYVVEFYDANWPLSPITNTGGPYLTMSGETLNASADAFHKMEAQKMANQLELKSGTYYFTVKNKGDGVTCADSEAVRSDNWVYVKPEKQLPAVPASSIKWNWPEVSWSAVNDTDYLLDYYYLTYYSETEDGDYSTGHGSWTESPDITSADAQGYFYPYGENPEGYYRFQVRAMSKDISACQDSEWSFSTVYHYQPGNDPEETPGDLTGDGKLTMADVLRLARGASSAVTLTEQEQKMGDINGDGKITMADVILLARRAADGNQ